MIRSDARLYFYRCSNCGTTAVASFKASYDDPLSCVLCCRYMKFLYMLAADTDERRSWHTRGVVYNPGIGATPQPGSLRAVPPPIEGPTMSEPDAVAPPVVPEDTAVLIDLSSIAHPIWHMSQANPDANYASQQIVARVRDLARGFPHVAICCDAGRSFRHDLTPSYKANRPESEAPLHHQIRLAVEQLQADGFPIWKAQGFEADDVIATAVTKALAVEGGTALIVSADKDLLQLVGPRVFAKSVRDGAILDDAAVWAKFGVRPDQMRDYLTLVGDASDNIHGAKGVGPKGAAKLLAVYDTLDRVYVELEQHGTKFTPAQATSLRDLQTRLETVRALITLRTDVEIPFEEIAAERTTPP